MATIETSIKMTDKASPTINKISTALNKANQHCEKLNQSSKKVFDTGAIEKTNSKLNQTANQYNQINKNIKAADASQKKFASSINSTNKLASTLTKSIKAFVLAFGGIALVKKSIDFMKKTIEDAQIQANAELQLKVVLANVGASPRAFDEIAKKASEIQKRGIFGDEAMLAGAAEFATYMNDKDAIKTMMDTLADYAIGMSGGKAVDTQGMVDYATGLGKVLNGSYEAMTKKGFKFSQAQKAIIDGTATHAQYVEVLGEKYNQMSSDMQKALTVNSVIEESWGNLYDSMSNTPVGRMTQFKNALSDIYEKAGQILGPHVTNFFNTLIKYLPQIEAVITGISKALAVVVDIVNSLVDISGQAIAYLQDHWSEINVVVYGLAAAFGVLIFALNPILFLVIAIIATLAQTVKIINKVTGQSISTIGIIAGAVAWLGSLIWNTIAVVWNFIAIFVEWIVNIIKHPLIAAKVALNNLTAYILDFAANITSIFDGIATNIANAMIGAINLIIKAWNALIDIFGPGEFLGIKFNKGKELSKIGSVTASIRSAAAGYRQEAENIKPDDYWTAPRMGFINTNNAYSSGYNWGASLGKSVGNTLNNLFSNGNSSSSILDDIANNTGNTAANTGALNNTLSATDEDLKYLREFAERDAINKFTTAQIKVDMTNNNSIASDMDIDGVVNVLTQKLNEQLATQVEGVYA